MCDDAVVSVVRIECLITTSFEDEILDSSALLGNLKSRIPKRTARQDGDEGERKYNTHVDR